MRSLLFTALFALICTFAAQAQFGRFIGKAGTIDFSSNAPLELIEATSKKLSGVIDPGNSNSFAFQLKVTTFEGFNSDLQKDHFNENYLESESFPKASFAGKIIEQVDLESNGTYQVRAKGKLKIHGVSQTRIIKTTLTVKDGQITAKSKFTVPLEDHDITIPKIVNQKIATEIDVTVKMTLAYKEE